MLAVTRSGFSALSRAASNPIWAKTPGRKFSTKTSLAPISRASTALPSPVRRLSESERLLRLKAAKYHESPSRMTPCARSGSPTPGVSTLTISAPMSASIIVQNGPARMRVRSTTRIPDSGT